MITFDHTSRPLFSDEHIEIKKTYDKGKDFLTFTFSGKLTLSSCEEGCDAWKQINKLHASTTFIHVWNCAKMTGFEQTARKKWMRAMEEMRDQMQEIWLITDNFLIRGSAHLMSKFSKHRLKTFKSIVEAEQWFQHQTSIDFKF